MFKLTPPPFRIVYDIDLLTLTCFSILTIKVVLK